jgi:hypothetical protein
VVRGEHGRALPGLSGSRCKCVRYSMHTRRRTSIYVDTCAGARCVVPVSRCTPGYPPGSTLETQGGIPTVYLAVQCSLSCCTVYMGSRPGPKGIQRTAGYYVLR